ncbi:hypothetical protein FOZ60_015556 [Perkinsus olseni]|uniref:Sodium/sulfate symporter n=1 Tax=Perkinsus olseni TaxID=32597 RepID=A0A7J6P5K8_PEROL|nr:hypothetical protein FOZ60_015556 [Perkinsus olseni]
MSGACEVLPPQGNAPAPLVSPVTDSSANESSVDTRAEANTISRGKWDRLRFWRKKQTVSDATEVLPMTTDAPKEPAEPPTGIKRKWLQLKEWHKNVWPGASIPKVAAIFALGLILWWLVPEGLGHDTWQVFVLFVCTIVAAVAEPLPLAGVCLVSLGVCAVTGVLTTKEMLSGFANSSVWLVMFAFFFSSGFAATGLGKRMCFMVLKYVGSTTLGLGYGICLCELVLSLAIPSCTARAAGVLLPILHPLMKEAFQSDPELGTQGRIGTYIVLVEISADAVAAAFWLTGGAWNAMMVQFMNDVGVNLSWVGWAYSQAPAGLIQLACIPLTVYFLYPPEVKKTPEAPKLATEKLEEMGPMGPRELTMLVVFIGMVLLWILSSIVKTIFPFTSTGVAAMGVGVLLLCGIIDVKKHIITDKGAFNLLLWFSVLLMLASELKNKGFWVWLADLIDLSSLPPYACLLVVCLIFYVTQYVFASITAHVSALYPALLQVALAAGVPPQVACRALALCTWSGHLTPYTSAANPAYFGMGYVTNKQWWITGIAVLCVNFVLLISVSFGYWWLLGYWEH